MHNTVMLASFPPRPFNYIVFDHLQYVCKNWTVGRSTCMEATVITHLSSLFYPQFCNSFLPLHLLPGCHAILLGLLQGVKLRYCIIKGQHCEWKCFLIIIFFFCSKNCMYMYTHIHTHSHPVFPLPSF